MRIEHGMRTQVSFFKEMVENNLRPKFSSTEKLVEYLSSSLYLIILAMAICALLLLTLFFSAAKAQLVPALYVFGDSTVDSGNSATVNELYGMDLNASVPHRWTNGQTTADFIATFMGLPLIPPYNHISEAERSKTGVNYGFSGCGILPETGSSDCVNLWNFDQQIAKFNATLNNNLTKMFNKDDLVRHLKGSIFYISFGINDYAWQYLPPINGRLSKLSPDAFAQLLLNYLSSRLRMLYGLGARKFLVNNIWPLGCAPLYAKQSDQVSAFCNKTINGLVRPYSNLLPLKLKELKLNLPGAIFSHSDDFLFVMDLKANTQKYGITNTTGGCLSSGNSGTACNDRDRYLYFDVIHTTQAANKVFARNCYYGKLCTPLNVMNLVAA